MASVLFASEGHTVTMASNPTEALGHAAAIHPEVVILDIGMPGMDGYELARAIRALGHKPRPLIIAVSGYTAADDIKRGVAAGFDFHYPKTIDPNVLLHTVSTYAGQVAAKAAHAGSGKPH
jgi:CheY-like chemotaxis protein